MKELRRLEILAAGPGDPLYYTQELASRLHECSSSQEPWEQRDLVGTQAQLSQDSCKKAPHTIFVLGRRHSSQQLLSAYSDKLELVYCERLFQLIDKLYEELQQGDAICAVSGSLSFHSATALIAKKLSSMLSDKNLGLELVCRPGLSSLEYLRARLLEIQFSNEPVCSMAGAGPLCQIPSRIVLEKFQALSLHGIRDAAPKTLTGFTYKTWSEEELICSQIVSQLRQAQQEGAAGVFFLLDPRFTPQKMLNSLSVLGLSETWVALGSELSCPGEELVCASLMQLKEMGLSKSLLESSLSIAAIELSEELCARLGFCESYAGMQSARFEREEGVPITKAEARLLIGQKLEMKPGALLYDLGSGTGSVGIEFALAKSSHKVIAVDKRRAAYELGVKNIQKFCLQSQMNIVCGDVLEVFKKLELPDCVFIGGASSCLVELLSLIKRRAVTELLPGKSLRIAATAATLQTAAQLEAAFAGEFSESYECSLIQISKSKECKGFQLFEAQGPLYLVSLNIQAQP